MYKYIVFLISFLLSSTYNIGDQISMGHQNDEHEICYGSNLDLNEDGVLNILDIVQLINLILE